MKSKFIFGSHFSIQFCSVNFSKLVSNCLPTTGIRRFSTELLAQEQSVETIKSTEFISPLKYKDYFKVNNLFTIKDLFDAKVHFGHKEGTLDDRMRPYIFGSRLGHLIFDLEQTALHLRQALNFTAHTAYRGGVILFVGNYHQHCPLIEQTAIDCKEYAHTRVWVQGTFTNSMNKFHTTIRYPDLCIIMNTLTDILHEHVAVVECAQMNIPVVAIVDSNCNPNIITYPIPGNDDSPSAVELYCKLFKAAILKGKEERLKALGK